MPAILMVLVTLWERAMPAILLMFVVVLCPSASRASYPLSKLARAIHGRSSTAQARAMVRFARRARSA